MRQTQEANSVHIKYHKPQQAFKPITAVVDQWEMFLIQGKQTKQQHKLAMCQGYYAVTKNTHNIDKLHALVSQVLT